MPRSRLSASRVQRSPRGSGGRDGRSAVQRNMRTYRFLTQDGDDLGTVTVASLAEAITSTDASLAPLGAKIVAADGATVLARKEMWAGNHPGWSLVLRTLATSAHATRSTESPGTPVARHRGHARARVGAG